MTGRPNPEPLSTNDSTGKIEVSAVRQLLPEPADIDPFEAHGSALRPHSPGRPWLLINMVTTLDGATAVGGVSGTLGGDADRTVFSAIRAVGDVILAGAATVRAEGYGPPRTPTARQAERTARGQELFPRIAVVTRSLDLDPTTPLFTDAVQRPLVYTVEGADETRWAALAEVAEVVAVGSDDVDMAAMAEHLYGTGARTVVVEGGPVINGHLLEAGLVDELNVTVAPVLAGGSSHRLTHGADPGAHEMTLAHLWTADDVLLARYVRT
ncbi:MAG: dihydrofolate reductase family protein [Aquihabitans sp.]